jgi:hypothetical protein
MTPDTASRLLVVVRCDSADGLADRAGPVRWFSRSRARDQQAHGQQILTLIKSLAVGWTITTAEFPHRQRRTLTRPPSRPRKSSSTASDASSPEEQHLVWASDRLRQGKGLVSGLQRPAGEAGLGCRTAPIPRQLALGRRIERCS